MGLLSFAVIVLGINLCYVSWNVHKLLARVRLLEESVNSGGVLGMSLSSTATYLDKLTFKHDNRLAEIDHVLGHIKDEALTHE